LVEELGLELLLELEIEVILKGQSLFTHHSLHGEHILTQGVVGVLYIGI